MVGAVLHAVWRLAHRDTPLTIARGLFSRASILLTLRAWAACVALWHLYPWVKLSIPLLAPARFDGLFWHLDFLLHLDISPSIFCTALFDGYPRGLLAVDTWYRWWIVTTMGGVGFMAMHQDLRVRRQFILSNALVWILGVWLHVAFPAVGPCYTHAEIWAGLREYLPRSQELQALLFHNYSQVLRGSQSESVRDIDIFLGVAAMPSLHVAMHWLLTLWIRRVARPFFVPALLLTLLTLLGSVVTGWHYIIDGYAGIALATVAYWLSLATDRERPAIVPAPPLGGDVQQG